MTGPITTTNASSGSASGRDWTVQVADAVESAVLTVKQKTTVPLTTIARGIVYGLVIAALGTLVMVLLAITSVRVLTVYIPSHRVWVSDLIVGGIFTVAGLFLWSKRTSKKATT